jgi:hypothetical protein
MFSQYQLPTAINDSMKANKYESRPFMLSLFYVNPSFNK